MNKKRIIAYSLAIASLFGIYKEGKELGKFIKENYLDDNNENVTKYTTKTTNPTIILPDNTIAETIIEETIPETTIIEETTPTEEIKQVFYYTFATDDLALFNEDKIVVASIEKYEKLLVTEIINGKAGCISSDQKVYCYYQGKLVLIADCVTGIPTYGTTKGTNKGYTEINGKSYNTTLMLDTPAEIFISFNPDGEGFHDSKRSQFGGDIYLTNGSHGCVNMRLEDVKVLDKHLKAGDHVLVHK